MASAQCPTRRGPNWPVIGPPRREHGVERDHPTDGIAATFVVERLDRGQARVTTRERRIARIEIDVRRFAARQARLQQQTIQRILVTRDATMLGQTQRRRDRTYECLGVIGCSGIDERFVRVHVLRKQRPVVPERYAVGAPQERDLPAGKRFTRIPLALPVVQEAAGRETVEQAPGERFDRVPVCRRRPRPSSTHRLPYCRRRRRWARLRG